MTIQYCSTSGTLSIYGIVSIWSANYNAVQASGSGVSGDPGGYDLRHYLNQNIWQSSGFANRMPGSSISILTFRSYGNYAPGSDVAGIGPGGK